MESTDRPPSLENSEQVVWNSEDHQGPSHVRSYECTFCKRGFSNAQALGGHMNIHRRDRAKLKHPTNDNQLSLNIARKNPSYPPPVSPDYNKLELESSEGRSCTVKWPWILSRDDFVARDETHVAELRQLPLFVETPSSIGNEKSSSHGGRQEDTSDVSAGVELDLELRLGPEPHDTSTTNQTTGTIEFF